MNLGINWNGPDWSLFEQWLDEELTETYKRLANPACSDTETNQLRGRALLIGQLLDLRNTPAGSDSPL